MPMDAVFSSFQHVLEHPLILGWLLGMMILATVSDVKRLKIPNRFNAVLAIVNGIIFVVVPLMQGNGQQALLSLSSAVLGFVFLLIPAVMTGFKMAGDIKFIGALGFAFHPFALMGFLFLSVILNALTNGLLIATKQKTFEAVIPFAPFFTSSFVLWLSATASLSM